MVRKAGIRVTDAEKQTGHSNEIPRLLESFQTKVTEQLYRIRTAVYHTRNLSLSELPQSSVFKMTLKNTTFRGHDRFLFLVRPDRQSYYKDPTE